MSVWKFGLSFLVLALGCVVGVVKPSSVAAANRDLFPSEWIEVVQIDLVTPPGTGEKADVYFPQPPDDLRPFFEDAFPVVAMLQGGLVDKKHYEEFGARLARFGFVVVIPNHFESLPPTFTPVPFPNEFVIPAVLAQIKVENNTNPDLQGLVNTDHMGITGHSAGGAAGMFAIDRRCQPPFCFGPPFFPLPDEVQAGAFYGTNTCGAGGELTDPRCIDFSSIPPNPQGQLFDIDNSGIPVALVQGSLDGISTPEQGQATFDILNGPRSLNTLEGLNHYGICDANDPSSLGPCDVNLPGPPEPDPNPQPVPQAESVQQVADAIGQFLRTHLTLCVYANPLLGEARRCTVFQLNSVNVELGGAAGGVFGDMCIGPNGTLSILGSQFVNGSVLLSPSAAFSQSGSTTVGGVVEEVDLSDATDAALIAAQDATAQPCTQTFGSLTATQTIVGNGGLNVICVGNVEAQNNTLITLSGDPDDLFIMNVTGKFEINGGANGGKIVVAGDVEPQDVLYNIIGPGTTVELGGGQGGENCCNARVDGTILAPERSIELNPGLVNGQIIAGATSEINSGASVSCPSVPADLIP